MDGDHDPLEGTITQRIRVLKDRIEDDTGTLKVLEESKAKGRVRLALDRKYPRRWKGSKAR